MVANITDKKGRLDEDIDVLDGEAITEAEISQRIQLVDIINFLKANIPSLKNILVHHQLPLLLVLDFL